MPSGATRFGPGTGMSQHSYADFDLLVESNGQGGYRARVLESPMGGTSASPVSIPFSDLEVENFLLKAARPRRDPALDARPPEVRAVRASEVAAARDFGGRLFDAVFQGRMR